MNAATISRILLGLGLIAAAFAIGRFGADAVPIWAIGLSASLGIDPAVGARASEEDVFCWPGRVRAAGDVRTARVRRVGDAGRAQR